jgi:predicted Mrr-cat superfamily restriction endonuclease
VNIWRVIAHHKDPEKAVLWCQKNSRIAIGWGNIGDLRQFAPQDASAIISRIQEIYPELHNANLGGPSLWRLYSEMEIGDWVILSGHSRRRAVMRITGNYEWTDDRQSELSGTYYHQRSAETTEYEPDKLWRNCGAKEAVGENIRWTLIRCNNPSDTSYRITR